MKRSKLLLVFATNLFLVVGCATMTQEECETADWVAVGYEDGKQGRSTQDISRHQKACTKHGVEPDAVAYLAGWDDGVLLYCTRWGGFNAGSRGGSYAGVCPEDLEEGFLVAYNDGRHLYNLRSKVETIESEISRREERIRKINKKLKTFRNDLNSSGSTEEDRAKIRKRIREVSKEKREHKNEIYDLRYKLRRAEARYEDYRSDIEHQYRN